MIFQAQSRMIFGLQGEDADLLANEVAALTFDPMKIKDEIHHRSQMLKGHRKITLESWNTSTGANDTTSSAEGRNRGKNEAVSKVSGARHETESEGESEGKSNTETRGRGTSSSTGHAVGEHLVPIHEEVVQLSSRTYASFDEQRQIWAGHLRKLRTGEALVRVVNDPDLYRIQVKRAAFGYLSYDVPTIARKFPHAFEAVDAFVEKNLRSEFFAPAATVDAEFEHRLQNLLHPPIEFHANGLSSAETVGNGGKSLPGPGATADESPFG